MLMICTYMVTENKVVGIMKPGHCFTIEPMINQGKDFFFFIRTVVQEL